MHGVFAAPLIDTSASPTRTRPTASAKSLKPWTQAMDTTTAASLPVTRINTGDVNNGYSQKGYDTMVDGCVGSGSGSGCLDVGVVDIAVPPPAWTAQRSSLRNGVVTNTNSPSAVYNIRSVKSIKRWHGSPSTCLTTADIAAADTVAGTHHAQCPSSDTTTHSYPNRIPSSPRTVDRMPMQTHIRYDKTYAKLHHHQQQQEFPLLHAQIDTAVSSRLPLPHIPPFHPTPAYPTFTTATSHHEPANASTVLDNFAVAAESVMPDLVSHLSLDDTAVTTSAVSLSNSQHHQQQQYQHQQKRAYADAVVYGLHDVSGTTFIHGMNSQKRYQQTGSVTLNDTACLNERVFEPNDARYDAMLSNSVSLNGLDVSLQQQQYCNYRLKGIHQFNDRALHTTNHYQTGLPRRDALASAYGPASTPSTRTAANGPMHMIGLRRPGEHQHQRRRPHYAGTSTTRPGMTQHHHHIRQHVVMASPATPPRLRLERTIPIPTGTKIYFRTIDYDNIVDLRAINTASLPITYNDAFYDDVWRKHPPELGWIAYIDGKAVGSIACRREAVEETTVSQRSYRVYIMTLCVLPMFRRLRIGSFLLQMVVEACQLDESIGHVCLHVQTSNERALRFYGRAGFHIQSRIDGYYRLNVGVEPPDAFFLRLETA